MYREYAPPPPLSGFVECFWRREGDLGQADDHRLILPDGRIDVVWTTDGETLVAGPQTRSLPRPLHAPFVALGARFEPGVGAALLGIPAHELVDMHVPLALIDTAAAARLSRRLTAGDVAAGLAELSEQAAPDPMVRTAARLLDRSRARVGRLAGELGVSERQLERRFRESVGYGPKTLQRVLRFRRFLAELRLEQEPHDGLAGLAYASGYADQAHLTRESRRLSGLSPVQLRRRYSPARS